MGRGKAMLVKILAKKIWQNTKYSYKKKYCPFVWPCNVYIIGDIMFCCHVGK